MSKIFIVMGIALAAALGVAGCGSTGETVGTVGGAALGGAAGSAVTGGSTFRGYDGEIWLPTDLEGVIQGVFGLDDHPIAR